jgi:hypothetical protein
MLFFCYSLSIKFVLDLTKFGCIPAKSQDNFHKMEGVLYIFSRNGKHGFRFVWTIFKKFCHVFTIDALVPFVDNF